jgi:hypothetical protein
MLMQQSRQQLVGLRQRLKGSKALQVEHLLIIHGQRQAKEFQNEYDY